MLFRQSTHAKRNLKSQFGKATLRLAAVLGLSGGILLAGVQAKANAATSVGRAVTFSCVDSEATIKSKGGPKVTVGSTSIYIGYRQVSSINKDPIIARFDSGRRIWCKTNYEVTGDDSTGYGLLWDGRYTLYGVFSATGTQGTSSQDFRRFATNGWLTNYGSGGGAKVAILAKIDPASGNVGYATFLSALNTNGKTNSLAVNSLSLSGTNLVVNASSWFSPRRTNRTAMTCSGASPFAYTIEFVANLSSATRASAYGCR